MIPDDIKVTNEMLWKGALLFAMFDIILVTALARIIKYEDLLRIKWKLILFMAFFFCVLFGSIVSVIFWDSVYSYVFPEWTRWAIPPFYGLFFSMVALLFWWLAFRLRFNPITTFCILGGLWGLITHVLAIYRGVLDKPPMLHGVSISSALTIAFFEFIFYWSFCLGFTFLFERLRLGKKTN